MDDELERMWKEAVGAYFEVVPEAILVQQQKMYQHNQSVLVEIQYICLVTL